MNHSLRRSLLRNQARVSRVRDWTSAHPLAKKPPYATPTPAPVNEPPGPLRPRAESAPRLHQRRNVRATTNARRQRSSKKKPPAFMIAAHGERRRNGGVFRIMLGACAAVLVGAFLTVPASGQPASGDVTVTLSTAKQRFDSHTDVTVTVVIANDGATDAQVLSWLTPLTAFKRPSSTCHETAPRRLTSGILRQATSTDCPRLPSATGRGQPRI